MYFTRREEGAPILEIEDTSHMQHMSLQTEERALIFGTFFAFLNSRNGLFSISIIDNNLPEVARYYSDFLITKISCDIFMNTFLIGRF